ncbi:hypothetical protein PILCRDRAFT_185124 [Piloderma croceum F 1598]|uniref:Uncharacterized protein n=1 Tax=Piloderma croceum (strain F 1598) TaxID=765440 RepID=A0A0C3BVB3_PILCF|nr:hypothetical protein PILCRDRAFT_185124 [Piloderma croceum F 1598]
MFTRHATQRALQSIPSQEDPIIFCGLNTSTGPVWVQFKLSDQWSSICQPFELKPSSGILDFQCFETATSRLRDWPNTGHLVIAGPGDWKAFQNEARRIARQSKSGCSKIYFRVYHTRCYDKDLFRRITRWVYDTSGL